MKILKEDHTRLGTKQGEYTHKTTAIEVRSPREDPGLKKLTQKTGKNPRTLIRLTGEGPAG